MANTPTHDAGVTATAIGVGRIVYRYKVDRSTLWGSFVDVVGDADHLLENEDCGPDKEWLVMDLTTGEYKGGGYGTFDGEAEVCPCGKYLTTKEHDCDAR